MRKPPHTPAGLPARCEYDELTERAVEISAITNRLNALYARMQRGERGTLVRQRVAAAEALLAALQGYPVEVAA